MGQAHVITGAFLGLIVGFRANTGYQRYWAARGAWGSVHKRCRSIALLLTTSIVGRDAIVLRTLYLLAAFPYALKQHLRGQHSMKELARILPPDDIEQLNQVVVLFLVQLNQVLVRLNQVYTRAGSKPCLHTHMHKYTHTRTHTHTQAANKPLLLCSLLSDTLKPLLQKVYYLISFFCSLLSGCWWKLLLQRGTNAEACIRENVVRALHELTHCFFLAKGHKC